VRLLDVHGHLVGVRAREVLEGLEQLGQQLQGDDSTAVQLQIPQTALDKLDPEGQTICQLRSAFKASLACVHGTVGYELSMLDSTHILQNLADFHMFLSSIFAVCVWLCFTSMSVSRNTQ
jgi:hypothetical protein